MVSLNETQQLGLTYEQVFTPYIASRIDEWINSKNYSSWPVCDSIGREKKVHEILNAPYCDLNSAESQLVQDLFAQNSIATGWVPDPSQRLFIFHSRGDDYVPVQSARPVLRHLEQYGFEPSIVPGRTHLQTNFVVPKLGHLTATVIYLIQSVAAIKAWPQMYADGELIEPYATWAQAGADFDLIATLRALDEMGIDCRSVIQAVIDQMQQGQGDTMNDIVAAVMARLAELGIDEQALREMGQDSGIDIEQLIADLVSYLNENPTQPEGMDVPARANAVYKSLTSPLTPADEYADQLRHWLESKPPDEWLAPLHEMRPDTAPRWATKCQAPLFFRGGELFGVARLCGGLCVGGAGVEPVLGARRPGRRGRCGRRWRPAGRAVRDGSCRPCRLALGP